MVQPAAKPNSHRWSFYRAGGVDQVRLDKGADVLNLDQLDQKLWVALSCPVKGLEFDSRTLELLDGDGDGFVRPPEILAAVKWLRDVLKSGDDLVEGTDGVSLAGIRQDTAEGKILLASAQHILRSLGKDKATRITVAEAAQTAEVFAKARRNGDGIVPPETIDDAAARTVAEEIVACLGAATDRSAKPGFDQTRLDAFFAACTDYDAWQKLAEADPSGVLPFGDATGAAFAAFSAVRTKVDDYFGRCRMAAFDPRALAAVNREEAAYIAAAAKDLSIAAAEIAHFPLALVEADKPMPLGKGVNPAWAEAIGRFRDACCKGKDHLTEAEWTAIGRRLAGHGAWLAKKAGAAVEPLGRQRVREILAGSTKATLQQAIDDDRAVATEVEAMTRVEKLARLQRDLHKLLCNYVSFTDFYARRGAIFQAGTLYLDGRALDLCFHVTDAGRHATMAPMAKTYLAYVDCTRPGGQKMQVACAFTAGDSDNLFAGRNGIFYDRKGNDWNATIARVVDNPISIGQAFWSPYKKLVRWIEEQVAKRAAAADADAATKLQTAAAKTGEAATTAAPAAAPSPPKKMDIGVLAAISVAISGVTAIVGTVLERFFGLGYLMPLGVLGVILLISGPAMLIAFMKLRQRNLGPILDANGWAVNTLTRVNIPLGGSLTELPRLPAGSERSLVDPYAPKKSPWPKVLVVLLVLAAAAYGLYRTNLLHRWLPDWVPAHHTEIDLLADKTVGAPGNVVTFTVRSKTEKLQVVDVTDANAPQLIADLAVAAGAATLTLPAADKRRLLAVRDAVSGTEVRIAVEPPAPK
jgi:hypothetical protein